MKDYKLDPYLLLLLAVNLSEALPPRLRKVVEKMKLTDIRQYPPKVRTALKLIKAGKDIPEDFWQEVGKELKELAKRQKDDLSLSEDQVKFTKDLGLYLHKRSEPAAARLRRLLKKNLPPEAFSWFRRKLKDPKLEAAKKLDVKKLVAALEAAVKGLTGKAALDIPDLEERRKAKAKNPELYQEFLALRRQLAERQKHEIEKLTVAGRVPIERVYQHFKKLGIPAPYPEGLKNLEVDAEGRLWYQGKRIEGNPPSIGKVIYPEEGKATYVFKVILPNGNPLKFYTEETKKKRRQEKYQNVVEAIKNIDEYRKIWLKALDSKGLTKYLAAMAELLYLTQARIGNTPPKDEKKGGYGLSTLRVKHVKFQKDGSVVLSYKGKKGVKQRHVIKPNSQTNKKIIEILKELTKEKGPNDFVFTYKGRRIRDRVLNKWLKEIGVPFTAHKFRHIIGTQEAAKLFAKAPQKFKSEKEAKEFFKKALEKVGKKLGHITGEKVSWTTARNNYVSPELMINFFKERGIRPPDNLLKLL